MTIRVLLFAQMRDAMDSDEVELELPASAAFTDLRAQLVQKFPQLATLASVCRFASAGQFVDDAQPVSPGVEIALIPPVSGG